MNSRILYHIAEALALPTFLGMIWACMEVLAMAICQEYGAKKCSHYGKKLASIMGSVIMQG